MFLTYSYRYITFMIIFVGFFKIENSRNMGDFLVFISKMLFFYQLYAFVTIRFEYICSR